MNQERTPGDADIGSDSLLSAYQLLIETIVESGDDDELLQRALAVLAAIRWPWTPRYLSACLPIADTGSLRLAAFVGGSRDAAPHCGEVEATACLCGLALVRPGRLICIDTSVEALPERCACATPGLHVILPLGARGRVLGMLHIMVEPGRRPGEAEQSFLVLVATLLGAELHRRRSEREHDRLEMQFLQAQKMEAVGRLAGGVAHDFNNILTAITSYADLGLLKLPEQSPLRRNFEEILAAADRAALLTQQLLAFSQRQPLSPRIIDVGEILGALGKPLRRLLGADMELSVRSDPGRALILADSTLVEQLLINLMVTARDTLPHGGAILIECGEVDLKPAFTLSHPSVPAGRHVCLTFAVQGPGLAAGELRAQWAEGDGAADLHAGAALGPAAVNDIIRQSGGVSVVDAKSSGSVVMRIYFPVARAETPAAEAAHEPGHLPRGTETVLIAEDDDSVRVVVAEILRDLGYQVLEARDGREAQALAAAHEGRIDALVADVVMPGLGGGELRHRLAAARPGLRALFVSGTAEHPAALLALSGPEDALLSKPFSPWALASRLRESLDAPRQSATRR